MLIPWYRLTPEGHRFLINQSSVDKVKTIDRARTACKDDKLFHDLVGPTYPGVQFPKVPAQQYRVAKVDLSWPAAKLSIFINVYHAI
jgi:hypothetical protein